MHPVTDLGAEYFRDRARELKSLRIKARALLRDAQVERMRQLTRGNARGKAESRAVLVRCKANLYIAEAFCEALETIR